MARGKTLLELLEGLRAECHLSLNPAHNNQTRDVHIKMLKRIQENLWNDFTWPHLRVRRTIVAQAGQRYISPPSDMGIDSIEKIEFRYGAVWTRLIPCIGREHYLAIDSDLDIRSWPVRRFQFFEGEQIELWPVPSQDGDADKEEGIIRFTGIRNLSPLVNDDDRADLDDELLILYAAANLMNKEDASKKLEQANQRYITLKGRLSPKSSFRMFGAAKEHQSLLRGPPRVAYRVVSG